MQQLKQDTRNENDDMKRELRREPEESKHESREHTQSTAVCHQASLQEVVEVGKRDESQQVDFIGMKSGSKPAVTASWWPREESHKVLVDDQERERVKQSFDLKITKKQMLPQSAILAMPPAPQRQLKHPSKNIRSPSTKKEEITKEQNSHNTRRVRFQKNIQIEHQISNLYKKQLHSHLSRDKRMAEESIEVLKNQTQVDFEDAQELREENQKMNNIIRKYRRYIENFDAEVAE